LNDAYALLEKNRHFHDNQQFHEALKTIWDVIGDANRYVDDMAPWALKKTDSARMADVLWVLCEVIRVVALMLKPYMPQSMERLLDLIGVQGNHRHFEQISADASLAGATPLSKPEPVFPRFVEEESGAE
jgi:methionyl-tRNA synthetase